MLTIDKCYIIAIHKAANHANEGFTVLQINR